VLGHTEAIMPYSYPAIFSMPVAFVFAWFFSITDRSPRAAEERARFHAQYVRSETGIGAESAVKH
jgi:cation/acetate symporter